MQVNSPQHRDRSTSPVTSQLRLRKRNSPPSVGMEHASVFVLLFVTFLQLCRAELSGSWYSANVINNGDFSPKPLTEIFTTTFSPSNPIVVLPSSTTAPDSVSTSGPSVGSSSFSTSAYTSELVSSTPSSQPTEVSIEPRPTQTYQLPPDPNFFQFPFQAPQQPNNPQQNPPNYFVIYQQAPQTVQNLPPSGPQQSQTNPSSTFQPELSTPQTTFSTFQPEISSLQTTFSTFQPDWSTPQTTFSTFQPELSTPRTTLSTFQPDFSSPQSTFSTFRQDTASTLASTREPSPAVSKNPETVRTTRTVPRNDPTDRPLIGSNPAPTDLSKFPTLRIRMVAPSGSITNININPTSSTTTRRTTTTRRPTTTRTRRTKRNRNNYDGCINACGGRRTPICASPLALMPIDPNRLKGFPSICHMACHNSFRKEQYEMLVDGRCGKLRTRIQTVDSNGKLKRVELNKAQYTIVDNPQTVVEFSALQR